MDLTAFVGSSGTVPQLAREESKALFLADEEHKKNVKKRADGADETAGMQQIMEFVGGISRRWYPTLLYKTRELLETV